MPTRGQTAGRFALEIGKADEPWQMSTEGGDATSEVVTAKQDVRTMPYAEAAAHLRPGGGADQKKQLAKSATLVKPKKSKS